MADAFTFELVSPERLLLSEQVVEVVAPGSDGYMTIMANHAPTMSTLQPGQVTVKTEAGAEENYIVFGGFVDILPGSCTLLAEAAVPASELSKDDLDARIAEAKEAAETAVEGDAKAKADTYLAQLTDMQANMAA